MKIDRAGFPFIAAALVPAVALAATRRYALSTPFAILGGVMAYFFRDPDRQVPQDPGGEPDALPVLLGARSEEASAATVSWIVSPADPITTSTRVAWLT